ncbi:helix-turn-helix domain-containing protein [Phycicoccus sp. Soil802]|uniref:helix-turn-helix domain-containing protein n=1 Tax=Phycicoccus sp. Soil802 TaxID=1736414 RepID=UPI0007038FFA|nr:hypothetical protein [Phycicoccus sp. Soil802]KRF28428.1 hypothetical protein ASG91_08200 [Phycicoccus sp. Soil802]
MRLYDVDGESERALRVIAYFDQLVRHHADVATVVRAGAALAECPAGIAVPNGLRARFGADGRDLAPESAAGTERIYADDSVTDGGVGVWLERVGDAPELDNLILERMAMAATAILGRRNGSPVPPAAGGLADPALLELLLSAQVSSVERARAARLAGIPVDGIFSLLAIRALGSERDIVAALRERWSVPVWGARVEPGVVAVLAPTTMPPDQLDDLLPHADGVVRSGLKVDDLAPAWRSLSASLRLAGLSTSWSRWLRPEDLGCLTLLADVDAEVAAHHPDVLALGRLRVRFGPSSFTDLDAVLTMGSMRQAAAAVHLHHTSLAERVRKYGAELGFGIDDSLGRLRLFVALALWTAAERQGRLMPLGSLRSPTPVTPPGARVPKGPTRVDGRTNAVV